MENPLVDLNNLDRVNTGERMPGPHPCVRWQVTCLRTGLMVLMLLGSLATSQALDEIVLKNGRRYLGTIISSTPELIVLAIDGGTVGFPRSIVASPPYHGATESTETTGLAEGGDTSRETTERTAPHPLPGVSGALGRLGAFPWVDEIRQVPVLVTDQGRWQFTPCVSFWAAGFFQLSIFGDPAAPAAIEVSLHRPQPTVWDQKQKLLEYILSLVPGLAVDNRFDRLDVRGDQFSIGELWFELTGPDSAKSPGRWVITLVHEASLKAARASYDDLHGISELMTTATIDPQQPRSWQRGSWTPDELAWVRHAPGATDVEAGTPAARSVAFMALGGERVFVRAYVRERDRYVRAAHDWTREFAPTGR